MYAKFTRNADWNLKVVLLLTRSESNGSFLMYPWEGEDANLKLYKNNMG